MPSSSHLVPLGPHTKNGLKTNIGHIGSQSSAENKQTKTTKKTGSVSGRATSLAAAEGKTIPPQGQEETTSIWLVETLVLCIKAEVANHPNLVASCTKARNGTRQIEHVCIANSMFCMGLISFPFGSFQVRCSQFLPESHKSLEAGLLSYFITERQQFVPRRIFVLWIRAMIHAKVAEEAPGPSFMKLGGRKEDACLLLFPLRLVRCKPEAVWSRLLMPVLRFSPFHFLLEDTDKQWHKSASALLLWLEGSR